MAIVEGLEWSPFLGTGFTSMCFEEQINTGIKKEVKTITKNWFQLISKLVQKPERNAIRA